MIRYQVQLSLPFNYLFLAEAQSNMWFDKPEEQDAIQLGPSTSVVNYSPLEEGFEADSPQRSLERMTTMMELEEPSPDHCLPAPPFMPPNILDLQERFLMIEPFEENPVAQQSLDGDIFENREELNGPSKTRHQSSKQKNSNCIKTIGRIILDRDNVQQYELPGEINEGLQRLKESIRQKTNSSKGKKKRADKFNTADLALLFSSQNQEEVRHNLAVTSRILRSKMRKQVAGSSQMKSSNPLMYLISLKCSCLRMRNKSLALRLQLPKQSHGETQ